MWRRKMPEKEPESELQRAFRRQKASSSSAAREVSEVDAESESHELAERVASDLRHMNDNVLEAKKIYKTYPNNWVIKKLADYIIMSRDQYLNKELQGSVSHPTGLGGSAGWCVRSTDQFLNDMGEAIDDNRQYSYSSSILAEEIEEYEACKSSKNYLREKSQRLEEDLFVQETNVPWLFPKKLTFYNL